MKKVLSLLLVFLFSLLLIPNIKAEEKKYFEVPMYDYSTLEDSPSVETYGMAIGLLVERNIISVIYENDTSTVKNGEKVVMIVTFDPNVGKSTYSIPDEVTLEDNIIYDFTPDDTLFIAQNAGNDCALLDYDGIKMIFAPGCEDNTICIAKTVLVDKSNGAIIKNLPSVDGLTTSFDVSFTDVNDQVKYKILIINNT